MLKEGELAPEFTALDHTGKEVKLSDFRGKKVWLWFFSSPGGSNCTRHSHGYRDNYPDLIERGIEVLGVNARDQESVRAWVEKESLPFPVILDSERTIAVAYGMSKGDDGPYLANSAEGRRPAVIVDINGLVLRWLPDLATVEEQIKVLSSLG